MSPLCDRKGIIVLLQYGRIAFYIDEKTRPRAKCRPSSVTEIRREELNEKNKITREDKDLEMGRRNGWMDKFP